MAQSSPSQDHRNRMLTPASVVTIVRICLVPVFIVMLLTPWPEWLGLQDFSYTTKSIIVTVIFVLISCTDWLDGYLARNRNEVSDFGKFMDPLADKILTASALLILVELQVLPSWPVIIILAREFIVAGVRMIAASKNEVIAASWYGKSKTVAQIIAIVLFLLKDILYVPDSSPGLENPLYVIAWIVMIIALILTIVSMLDYLRKARHLLGFNVDAEQSSEQGDNNSNKNDASVNAEIGESLQELSDESSKIEKLAKRVISQTRNKGISVGTAESLTGGLIAASLTAIPGSSEVMRGSVVSYAVEAKKDILHVSAKRLEDYGAVDEEVALEMASGARDVLKADLCVAVTGIAGPGGAEPDKPVGTVWIAADNGKKNGAFVFHFSGDRQSVRIQTVEHALELLLQYLP